MTATKPEIASHLERAELEMVQIFEGEEERDQFERYSRCMAALEVVDVAEFMKRYPDESGPVLKLCVNITSALFRAEACKRVLNGGTIRFYEIEQGDDDATVAVDAGED